MRQKIFTPKFAEYLTGSVEENLDKYIDSAYNWEEHPQCEVQELDFEQPDLSEMMKYTGSGLAKDDFYAAKILYESYREHLTPLKAAQIQFWQYLSHVVLKDYMRARWSTVNTKECPASYIKEHWFYSQGRIRNWLEGMFWSVHCTVIENEDKTLDYKYTEFLFSIQKIRDRGIGAATYVISNPSIVQGMLDFYMDELDKKEKGEDTVFDKYFEYRTDECIQLVNKLGGVIELSSLSKEDIYNFLNENRDYIKSVGDRKKEKKLREQAAAEQAAAEGKPIPTAKATRTNKKKRKRKAKRR